jgi:hypothetical protein
MILRFLKIKLAALMIGAMLLQVTGPCVPTEGRSFEDLTETGGILVGVLIIPKLPAE